MTHFPRALLALLLLGLTALFSLSGNSSAKQLVEQSRASQSKAVVFAVFGEGTEGGASARMEPILIAEGGKLTEPVSGSSGGDEINRFSAEHYQKGRQYRLLFGGAEAGSATIKKSNRDEECFSTGADVSLQTDAKLNRNVMALATDSKSLGLGASGRSRRSPTETERAQALELARAAYKQKGVAASLLPAMQVVNLTAIDLDRDGHAELAGSFVVNRGKQARHVLFLLILPQGASYRTAFSNFQTFTEKDVMSGASLSAVNEGIYVERLVDHLDLDGDNISELITTTTGLEGVSYYIYKRQNGQWAKVYEFDNYRCAF